MSDKRDFEHPEGEPSPLEEYRCALGVMSDYDLTEQIIRDTKVIAEAEANRLLAIATLNCRPSMRPLPLPGPAGAGSVRVGLRSDDVTEAELEAVLHLSSHEAATLLQLAKTLSTRLPRTLTALREGTLTMHRAQMISDSVSLLADDHFRAAIAEGLSPAEAEKRAAKIAGDLEEHILKRAGTQNHTNLAR